MSSLTPRVAWVDPKLPVTGPKGDLSKINRIVIHYPGVNPGALNLDNPPAVLRSTHVYYMHKSPPYAIGYNFATFPSGRFELRGFDIKNAANLNHNDDTLSINVMVNGQDEATPMQVTYTQDMVADIWARLGRQVPLVAHGDLSGAQTACPGAGIRRQLAAGLFLPQTHKPDPIDPPTPAPTGDLMIGIVHGTDFNAEFIGYYTGDGVFLDLHWVHTPAQVVAEANHRAAGAKVFTFAKAALGGCWVDVVPEGDGKTVWAATDFAGVR